MLKRLVDEESLDEGDRRLSELFRSAAPFEVDPFRKRRILVRLERASSLTRLHRPLADFHFLLDGHHPRHLEHESSLGERLLHRAPRLVVE